MHYYCFLINMIIFICFPLVISVVVTVIEYYYRTLAQSLYLKILIQYLHFGIVRHI